MKVLRFHETGGPEVLRYEDADTPEPGAGEVRIRVAGSAFNPADPGIRSGTLPFPVALPHTPGYDVAGTIDAVGDGVADFAPGDAVVGFLSMTADGSAAERPHSAALPPGPAHRGDQRQRERPAQRLLHPV